MNKSVDIQGYGLGSFNRVLGVIYLNGTKIKLEMVKASLAEAYRGRPPEGFDITPYLEAEKEGREARRGMWSLGDEFISPGKWRKMYRDL